MHHSDLHQPASDDKPFSSTPASNACSPAEDEQFREEKGVIIKEISTLEAPAAVQGEIQEATKHMF